MQVCDWASTMDWHVLCTPETRASRAECSMCVIAGRLGAVLQVLTRPSRFFSHSFVQSDSHVPAKTAAPALDYC